MLRCSCLNIFLLATLLISFPVGSDAQEDRKRFGLELEVGPVWQTSNDVRIPGDTGTEFSFKDLTGAGPYASGRLMFDWDKWERHGLQFVYIPLQISGTGTLDRPTSFNGSTFAPGVDTEGTYKFNTYRLTYKYSFLKRERWHLRIGGTLLIRDAEIELSQPGVSTSDKNVGVAPLVFFSGEYAFAKRWTGILDFDGLAGGPGRALDLALKVRYDLTDRWGLGVGYRTLEGGVDTDDTYNIAWLNYLFLSVSYRF